MPQVIKDLMPGDLEFQMFVLDELADGLIEKRRRCLEADNRRAGIIHAPIRARRHDRKTQGP